MQEPKTDAWYDFVAILYPDHLCPTIRQYWKTNWIVKDTDFKKLEADIRLMIPTQGLLSKVWLFQDQQQGFLEVYAFLNEGSYFKKGGIYRWEVEMFSDEGTELRSWLSKYKVVLPEKAPPAIRSRVPWNRITGIKPTEEYHVETTEEKKPDPTEAEREERESTEGKDAKEPPKRGPTRQRTMPEYSHERRRNEGYNSSRRSSEDTYPREPPRSQPSRQQSMPKYGHEKRSDEDYSSGRRSSRNTYHASDYEVIAQELILQTRANSRTSIAEDRTAHPNLLLHRGTLVPAGTITMRPVKHLVRDLTFSRLTVTSSLATNHEAVIRHLDANIAETRIGNCSRLP